MPVRLVVEHCALPARDTRVKFAPKLPPQQTTTLNLPRANNTNNSNNNTQSPPSSPQKSLNSSSSLSTSNSQSLSQPRVGALRGSRELARSGETTAHSQPTGNRILPRVGNANANSTLIEAMRAPRSPQVTALLTAPPFLGRPVESHSTSNTTEAWRGSDAVKFRLDKCQQKARKYEAKILKNEGKQILLVMVCVARVNFCLVLTF
jgi:hypothetical protein